MAFHTDFVLVFDMAAHYAIWKNANVACYGFHL